MVPQEPNKTMSDNENNNTFFTKTFAFLSDADNTIDATNTLIAIANQHNDTITNIFNNIDFPNLSNQDKMTAFSNALYLVEDTTILVVNNETGNAFPLVDPIFISPPTTPLA